MLFNSIEYLQFFPIVLVLFVLFKGWARILLLLGASYYFYATWNPSYLILIVISTLIDYFAGRLIHSLPFYKFFFLGLSLVTNIGLLGFFKYFNFFREIIIDLTQNPDPLPGHDFLLPIGISFYTFQTLSYTIDLYYGRISVEKNIFRFATYVAFFPQLIAGPIERAGHLLPQFKMNLQITQKNLSLGFRYILWGFFEKLVLADRFSIYSDEVFSSPGYYSGWSLWLGLLFFSFQIYFDFSAYSNIAIGTGRVFGIEIMENFRRPYFAVNISDFWHRWHISLSTWFRDYVYIPLGGNKKSISRHLINILCVFTLSGLWHGANYNFFIWGLLHGVFMCLYVLNSKYRIFKMNLNHYIKVGITFFFIVLTWVPFRITDPFEIYFGYLNLFRFDPNDLRWIFNLERSINLGLLGIVLSLEFYRKDTPLPKLLGQKKTWVRWLSYYIMIALILWLGKFNRTPFIYFQF